MRPVTISITFFVVLATLATTSTASNEQIDLVTIKCKKYKFEVKFINLSNLLYFANALAAIHKLEKESKCIVF
jgi:hypothetical protein